MDTHIKEPGTPYADQIGLIKEYRPDLGKIVDQLVKPGSEPPDEVKEWVKEEYWKIVDSGVIEAKARKAVEAKTVDEAPEVEDVKPWSGKYDRCRDCGRTDRAHTGRGLCSACYTRHRTKGTLDLFWDEDYIHDPGKTETSEKTGDELTEAVAEINDALEKALTEPEVKTSEESIEAALELDKILAQYRPRITGVLIQDKKPPKRKPTFYDWALIGVTPNSFLKSATGLVAVIFFGAALIIFAIRFTG